MTFDRLVDALGEAWEAWAATGRSLDEASWRAPTRLGSWDVAAVFAHASRFPEALTRLTAARREGAPDWTAASDLLRAFNEPGGVAHTAAAAVEEGATVEAASVAPAVLVERFARDGPAALQVLRTAGPITVEYFVAGTIPLAEAVRIGVMEATVHLLDVQRAVGAAPAVPDAALALTRDLLVAMAPAVDLVEAATGRTSASPFPVLR